MEADKMAEQPQPHTPGKLRHWLNVATEPAILFPVISIIVLAVIWGMTLNLIRVQRTAAENRTTTTTLELAGTYEAQVLRSLREIDQNLNLIKHEYETGNQSGVLSELRDKGLLLPDMLFTISIANSQGNIIESTGDPLLSNVVNEDYFRNQLYTDMLAISRPHRDSDTGDWKLEFSHRLSEPGGEFAGVVIVAVDAAYFVSGYEASKLGEQGLLGLLGSDGIFRVRRTGETVTAGGEVDYATMVSDEDVEEATAKVMTSGIDGVTRYISARQLYDLPLAVVVGLSVEEQLAVVRSNTTDYLWRAAAGSLLLIFVMFLLGRMSRELA